MTLAGSIAVFTHQQAPAVDTAVAQLKQANALVTDVTVLSVAAGASVAQTVGTTATGEFDGVVAFNEEMSLLSTELHALAPLVKAGGALHVYVADATEDKKSSILMALMIGGFVDAVDSDTTDAAAFFPEFSSSRCFSSKKPAFESGAALSLSLSKKTTTMTTTTTTTALPLKKWTVLADEFNEADDDEDIIDEDTLLDDTDEVLQAAKDDCGPGVSGKKRACKNCTCGLKDEEDEPVVSDKELTQMVSSCGNCFKGDAFRCGSCPFLGKPAFKPGMEKVLLNLDDADDF